MGKYKMKILIIGGNGTIGSKVTHHFSEKNEVIVAGRKSGDVLVDIADINSIKKMFDTTGTVDSIICIAGEAKWDFFNELSEEDGMKVFDEILAEKYLYPVLGKPQSNNK